MSAIPIMQTKANTTNMIRSLAGSPVVTCTFSFSLVEISRVAIAEGDAYTADHNRGSHKDTR